MDNALFIICLDDSTLEDLGELCSNYLCGTYNLVNGIQVGTCTNRWYDKVKLLHPYKCDTAEVIPAANHCMREWCCRYQL